MSIRFFDSLQDPRYPCANFFEDYLYLEGIVNDVGFCKYTPDADQRHLVAVTRSPSHWTHVVCSIIKICTYILFPLLALIALCVKAAHRSRYSLKIDPKDIGVTGWMYQEQLFSLMKLLKKQYAHLWIPPEGCYTIKLVSESYSDRGKTYLVATRPRIDFPYEGETSPLAEFLKTDKNALAFPLFVSGNHWTLVYIDRERRAVEYYDSKKNYGNHKEIVSYLQNLANTLTQEDPGKIPYQFQCKITQKLQPDTYQCGPWTLYFLEERLKNPDVDFNQLDVSAAQQIIADYRARIRQVLLEV